MFLRLRRGILRAFYFLLFLEIVLGFPIVLENRKPTKVADATVNLDPQIQKLMTGIHLSESREGDRDWELFAEEAKGLENQDSWELGGVRVLFYSKSALEFTVRGEHGAIDQKTKNVRIFGDVVTEAKNGYVYETEEVQYQSAARQLLSPKAVLVKGPPDESGNAYQIHAGSSEGDIAKSEVTLKHNIVGEKKMSPGKTIVIRAESAKIFGTSKEVQFDGGVNVQYDTFKIEGQRIVSQMSEDKNNPLSALTKVFGAVKLVDQDKYATADELEIHPETNRIILKGKPRLVQGEDEIFGNEITLIDSGRKIQVDQLRANIENLSREEKK